jgi:hypothetical protein
LPGCMAPAQSTPPYATHPSHLTHRTSAHIRPIQVSSAERLRRAEQSRAEQSRKPRNQKLKTVKKANNKRGRQSRAEQI